MSSVEALLTSLRVTKDQFKLDALTVEECSDETVQTFWRDFDAIGQIYSQEVNKLALYLSTNDQKEDDMIKLTKGIETAAVKLLEIFLKLPKHSGRCLGLQVKRSCVELVQSTIDFLVSVEGQKSREFVLQSVGGVWEKSEVLTKMPRNNAQAVAQALGNQKTLISDALEELKEAQNQIEELDDADAFDLGCEKWTPDEEQLLAPSIGLLKTCFFLMKKLSSSVAKSPANDCDPDDTDILLDEAKKVSPAVDDFALSLYPSIDFVEAESNANALVSQVKNLLDFIKPGRPYLPKSEYDSWGSKLLEAVDHNKSKFDLVCSQCKMNSLSIDKE